MGRFETRWLTLEKNFRRSPICPANGPTAFDGATFPYNR
jgi:hypothetical protein